MVRAIEISLKNEELGVRAGSRVKTRGEHSEITLTAGALRWAISIIYIYRSATTPRERPEPRGGGW